jgi:hypothetical protein
MKTKIYFLVCLVVIVCAPLAAQNVNRAGISPAIDYSGRFSNKWSGNFYTFSTFHLYDFSQQKIQSEYRYYFLNTEASLSYHTSEKLSLSGGLVFQRYVPLSRGYLDERRIFIQGSRTHLWDSTVVKQRLRFELLNVSFLSINSGLYHRLRYRLGIESPISDKLYFTAFIEPMINTSNKINYRFIENWLYFGIGRHRNHRNRLELGCMNISWRLSRGNWFNQYYLQASWIRTLSSNN